MATTVSTAAALGAALKEEQDEIEIEGDLVRRIIRIKATGNVAWAVAIGAIAVAVVALLAAPATGGTSVPAGMAALAPAAVALEGGAIALEGMVVATCAVAIAIAAGGIGALNSLRKYKMTKLPDGRLLLKK